MKKLIPISLFAFVMVFCGCEGGGCEDGITIGHKQQTYYMPDSVKPLFNVGDTFFYETQDKILFDTLVVTYLGYRMENDGDKKTSDEREYLYCDIVSTKLDLKFFLWFKPYADGLRGGIEVSNQNGLYRYDSKDDEIVDGCKLLPGKNYDNNTIPTAIYYSRHYGILKYEFADSVCYSVCLKN